ncbi:UNKNOWN [Stylonychia lemnae]|uniref:Uncharacterized protein n=1 Tax=Stylonychia lemnae TaxID=5949 RepID=A0A078AVS5_STYLE|nr:UNKNOWN [Stylonychia lemnae]|eukprot:CDW86284.1 UNKNOWN [Stylonychia lemnae]
MNERLVEEQQKTSGIGGYQKKCFEHTKYNEVKGIISYDTALQYRKENVPEKINKVKHDNYHKPQEYVARNITYCMNQHQSKRIILPQDIKYKIHQLRPKQIMFPSDSQQSLYINDEYSQQKNRFSSDNRKNNTSQKQRVKLVMVIYYLIYIIKEERRKKLLFNVNPAVNAPVIQKTFSMHELRSSNLTGMANNRAQSQSKNFRTVKNLPDKQQTDLLREIQNSKMVGYSRTMNKNQLGSQSPRSPGQNQFQFFQSEEDLHEAYQKAVRFDGLKLLSPPMLNLDNISRPMTSQVLNTQNSDFKYTISDKLSHLEPFEFPEGLVQTQVRQLKPEQTMKLRQRNKIFMDRLISDNKAGILMKLQYEIVVKNLEQISHELETGHQIREQRVKMVGDFNNILKKFLKKLAERFWEMEQKQTQLQNEAIQAQQEKDIYHEQLKAFQNSDFNPGEKVNLITKIKKLQHQLQEGQLDEYTKEVERLNQLAKSENDQTSHFQDKIRGFNDLIQKLDNDLKSKDKLIVKLQWSKGEIKDQIFERDKVIEDLSKRLNDLEQRNGIMEKEMKENLELVALRESQYESKKQELYKLQEEFKRKCETFDTLRAVAKEIQRKNEELEKEVWMGKGGTKESDPIGAEVLLDQFLFGSQNPYALSNNTKLSVILRGKELRIGNSSLEQNLIKDADMKKIETADENDINNIIQAPQDIGDNQTIINFKDFPLYSYFYGRPNFIIFLDHLIRDPSVVYTQNDPPKKLKFDPPFTQWLFATCRAILDSKYFEYVLYEDIGFANVSRLADFAYSWLGQFRVDESTRSVRKLDFEERERADEYRLQFAIGLQSVKASRMWEYQIFNDFLLEKNSHDELFFYLHCRQILFRGPQLLDSSSTHERVFNLDIKRIQGAMDIIFSKTPVIERDQMLKHIKSISNDYQTILLQQQAKRDERAKQTLEKLMKTRQEEEKNGINKKEFDAIDVQIVLRIFLEYYVREKKVRACILKRLFEEQPRLGTSSKAGISFLSFRKVMEQYDPEMLDLDIATMYRDAWTAGIGVVNFDSFFLTANEKSFFLKTVRFMSFNTPPQMNSYEEFDLENKYNQKLDYIYNLWRKEENMFINFKKRMEETGNELMVAKFNKLEDLIRKKSQLDLSMYRGRDLIQIFRRLWQWMLFYRSSYMEVYEKEENCSNHLSDLDVIKSEFSTYGILGERIFREIALVKAQQLKRSNQIKKIQKIYREQKNQEWEQLQQKLFS